MGKGAKMSHLQIQQSPVTGRTSLDESQDSPSRCFLIILIIFPKSKWQLQINLKRNAGFHLKIVVCSKSLNHALSFFDTCCS